MILVASSTTIVSPDSATMDTLSNAETRARFPWVLRYRIYNLPEVRS